MCCLSAVTMLAACSTTVLVACVDEQIRQTHLTDTDSAEHHSIQGGDCLADRRSLTS